MDADTKPQPVILLSPEARKRFREEIAQIQRTTRGQVHRTAAINYAINKLKRETPDAFRSEAHG